MTWPPQSETLAAVEWLESLDNLMHPTVQVMREMFELIEDDIFGTGWEEADGYIMRVTQSDYDEVDAA